jgi:hypothetical protein
MAEETQDGRAGDAFRQPVSDEGGGSLRAGLGKKAARLSPGVKVPDDLREAFEDLIVDNTTMHAKYLNFCQALHEEQKALVLRSKELWAEARSTMGLEGEWRYLDGRVHPMDETETK